MLVELFQKNQLKSLYLLGAIIVEKANTIESLSVALDLTNSSTKRTLQSLTADLEELFPDQMVLSQESSGIYLAPAYHGNRSLPIIRLTNHYLTLSPSANLLKRVIESKQINIVSLSNSLNIAQSYCYALIKNLNLALKKYLVQLSVKDNQVELAGEEIRLILLTYHFQKWQYEIDDTLLNDFLAKHPYLKNKDIDRDGLFRLEIFIEALLTRGLPSMPSEHYNEDLDQLHTLIQADHDYFQRLPKPKTYKGERLKRAVNSVARLWIVRINDKEEQLSLAKEMMELDNPITRLAHDLTSSFIYRFKLTDFQNNTRAYAMLFFHLTINLMYIYQFRIDYARMFYPSSIDIFADEKRDYAKLSHDYQLIDRFIREVKIDSPIWDIACSPQYKENMVRIFYASFTYFHRLQLAIYVDLSATIDGLFIFKQKLSHSLSENIYTYTDDPEKADIVFIDHGKQLKTNGQIFLLYNLTTTAKWQEVFSFILNTYFEKLDASIEESMDDYFI